MFRITFLLILILSGLKCSASPEYDINSSGFRDIRPIIFSNLDEKAIKSARLTCIIWNKTIKEENFDLRNPHLCLPRTVMTRLLAEPVFTDAQRATSNIEVLRYNFFARYFHDVTILDNPEFGLKNKILFCPVKQLRAEGYTFLFTRCSCDENALLYASYVPPENRSAAQTDILMNYLKGILRQASQPLYILSANGESIKFEPYLLTLVEDKKNPENDRHPLELEALKVLKQLKAAAYRKKLKDKCCQIHRQTQQVARYISWAALGVIILRVTLGF